MSNSTNTNIPADVTSLISELRKDVRAVGTRSQQVDARMCATMIRAVETELFPFDTLRDMVHNKGTGGRDDAQGQRINRFLADVLNVIEEQDGKYAPVIEIPEDSPAEKIKAAKELAAADLTRIKQSLRRAYVLAYSVIESGGRWEVTKSGRLSIEQTALATKEEIEEAGTGWASNMVPLGTGMAGAIPFNRATVKAKKRLGVVTPKRATATANTATKFNESLLFVSKEVSKVLAESDTGFAKEQEETLIKLGIMIDRYIERLDAKESDDKDSSGESAAA